MKCWDSDSAYFIILYFYNNMMEEIREAIENHRWDEYKKSKLQMVNGEE